MKETTLPVTIYLNIRFFLPGHLDGTVLKGAAVIFARSREREDLSEMLCCATLNCSHFLVCNDMCCFSVLLLFFFYYIAGSTK